MTEFSSEPERAQEGNLGRDFISMTPEAIRLRQLIDAIGSFVVVVTKNDVDVIETVSFNG